LDRGLYLYFQIQIAILVGFDTTNNDSPLFPSKYLYRLNLPFFVGNPLFYFPESSTTPLQLLTPVTEEFLPYMLIYNGKFLPYNDLIQLESILDQPKDKLDDVFIPSSIIIRNQLIILNILLYGFNNLKGIIKYGNPSTVNK